MKYNFLLIIKCVMKHILIACKYSCNFGRNKNSNSELLTLKTML